MPMHKILIYAAFGWLAFTGMMHFIVDVLLHWPRLISVMPR